MSTKKNKMAIIHLEDKTLKFYKEKQNSTKKLP